MAKKTEELDQKELAKDQIIQKTLGLSVMDKEATEALDKLAGELTVKDMLIFQPIVEMTNEVADIINIKYDKEDDKTVQAYKDGKKTYGAFNTKMREAKAELKEPYTGTIKAIDTVFKKFGEVYTLAKDHLDNEFKPYTDEQQRLKDERQKKKDAAKEKELADLKSQNKDILEKTERDRVLNAVQYNVINEYKTSAIQTLNLLNTDSIEKFIEKMDKTTLEDAIYNADKDVLPADLKKLELTQVETLEESFNKSKVSIKEAYRTRLTELVELQNMRSSTNTTQAFVAKPEVPNAPVVSESKVANLDDWINENFIKNTLDMIMEIRDNCDMYFDDTDKPDKNLAKDMSIMLTRTLEFINAKLK